MKRHGLLWRLGFDVLLGILLVFGMVGLGCLSRIAWEVFLLGWGILDS